MPVEKLENLDGHLAAVVEPVAEVGGRELARRRGGRHVDGDARHVLHDRAREKVVVRDLLDVAAPRRHAHQAAHEGLVDAHGLGDVAHPRRAVGLAGEPRQDQRPDPLLLGGELHLVAGPPHPRAVERHLAALGQLAQRRQEQRRRQQRLLALAQLLDADAGQIGPLLVEGIERAADRAAQALPGRRQHGGTARPERERHQRQLGNHAFDGCRAERPVAREGIDVDPGARTGQQRRDGIGRLLLAPWRRSRRAAPASAGAARGARRSISTPPPTVRLEEVSRTTKRSPAAAAIGRSSTSCT